MLENSGIFVEQQILRFEKLKPVNIWYFLLENSFLSQTIIYTSGSPAVFYTPDMYSKSTINQSNCILSYKTYWTRLHIWIKRTLYLQIKSVKPLICADNNNPASLWSTTDSDFDCLSKGGKQNYHKLSPVLHNCAGGSCLICGNTLQK